ncbi:MAG: DUF5522 domain-containing protein [Pyrinomonadaceae bacterium]
MQSDENKRQQPVLEEGLDFDFEDGLMVLTAKYLLERGYCCGNLCRNCPYPDKEKVQSRNSSSSL